MKSNLDFYDTPTISQNMYVFTNFLFYWWLNFLNKSCEIVGGKYYK